MSLINDAIKKANQANKAATTQTGNMSHMPTDGMHAAHRPAAPPAGSMTGMFIIAGVVVFVLIGGFLLVLGMKNRTPTPEDQLAENVQPVVIPDQTVSAPLRPAQDQVDGNPVVVHTSIEEVINEANPHLAEPPATPAPVNEPATPPAVETPAPPIVKPEFPKLKLQGIFYRLNNPSVMINGKALWVGDDIEGAVIKTIERDNVTLEFEGKPQTLRLR